MGLFLLLLAANATDLAYEHFYNLEFDQAIAIFRSEIAREPANPSSHNHLAQSLLYKEMLRSGALESELVSGANPFLKREKLRASAEFESAIQKSLDLTSSRLTTNPNDIDALYAQGVAYGLRGNYNWLVRKAWTDALRDITNSRKAHDRVIKVRPTYVDAMLVEGVHDYIVGSLPWTYKILGFVVGFRGDKEEGIRTVQRVAREGTVNSTEAKVLLAAVFRRERRAADAIVLLKDLLSRYPRNYLFRLEMVQMYADLGEKEKALTELRNIEQLKRMNTPALAALPPEKISYSRGNLLFWYRDYDFAIEELKKVSANVSGVDLNTGSMAFLRLGQCYDMKLQRQPALDAYRAAIALAPDSDAARQSRQFLSQPYRRGKA